MEEEVKTHTRSKRPVGYVVPDAIHQPLHVITTLYNPIRWQSRWKLYERFAKHVADSGAVLTTVEISFGERDHASGYAARDDWRAKCDFRDDMVYEHQYIRFQTNYEIWLKEAAIRAGVSRLPLNWKYVAWVDADVLFLRPNWVGECIHQLQHYDIIQMFSHAQDLGPGYQVIGTRPSFCHAYLDGSLDDLLKQGKGYDYYYYGGKGKKGLGAWSGLAWACTRSAWDRMGGLMDFCITGAADWYTAFALIGKVKGVIPKGSHPRFEQRIIDWENRAEREIRRNVGCMSGTVAHMFHGRKEDRKYMDRSRLLADLQFNPDVDMRYDWQGMPQLVDDGSLRFIKLRDAIREWMRERNEDTTEV